MGIVIDINGSISIHKLLHYFINSQQNALHWWEWIAYVKASIMVRYNKNNNNEKCFACDTSLI